MMRNTMISIPTLVRIKRGAIDRVGIYSQRLKLDNIVLLMSEELDRVLVERIVKCLTDGGIKILKQIRIHDSTLEQAEEIFQTFPQGAGAIIGFGGGKALDVAKYVSFLTRLPYIAVPTALSNDGFSSPQSSLELKGKRRSVPSAMPYGVVIDTEVCLNAPLVLWWSGIGDLVAKITAVYDWKMAFKIKGTQVDDFAALLSDATVFQLMAKPEHNIEGIRLLGTALLLNGISMEICGSSRPASGSEHLVSHALDEISKRHRLHGIQVGVATYIVSQLQKQGTDRIAGLFDATDFWKAVKDDPFDRNDWIEAFKIAPTIKKDYYTILSERDWTGDVATIIDTDPKLKGLFSGVR